MKKTIKSVVMLGTLCSGMLHASWEFRTPLSAQWRGYFHWQLSSVADAWWYDTMPSQKDRTLWDFHFWGVGYTRSASEAFFNPRENHNTRHKAPLSSLFFGKIAFVGEEAFSGGTFLTSTPENQALVNNANPFLTFARIMPQFDYNENGAFMGVEASRNFGREDQWHVGVRASIPYKVIEIEQESDFILEETLNDVVATRPVSINETSTGNQVEYAYRFDFLNSLFFTTVTTPSNLVATRPVVVYPENNQTLTIAGVNVMGTTADAVRSAYATVSQAGTIPATPFRKLPEEINGPLAASGQAPDKVTEFFQTDVAYGSNLARDRALQSTLFIVPRAEVVAGNVGSTLTTEATAIYTAINNLINTDLLVSQTATQFFLDNGIDFAGYSRNVGIGDLATEVYGGYGDKQNWFFDGIFGLQFPTGKRQSSSNDIYFKPTGNNGHVELKLGIDTGWRARDWFAFEFDLAYHHAFKRTERRAATFVGATVTNVGPEVNAKVSWNYFVGRIDLNFFHPHNPDMGMTFGYELFAKGKDKVHFDQATATDLLGRPDQPIDANIYEKRTNALSNKLRAQMFNRWNYFEVFAGGSQVVAGRDVMRETEAHIGFVVYF